MRSFPALLVILTWIASLVLVGMGGFYLSPLKRYLGDILCRDLHVLERCGLPDPEGREEAECSRFQGEETLVLLTFGQSNAANSASARWGTMEGVFNYNFIDRRCYRAEDPLLGATGIGGSVWMPVAQEILESKWAKRVLLVPLAVSNSSITQWGPGAMLSQRLLGTLEGLGHHGLTPHALLWHHGETDARGNRSDEFYGKRFMEMVDHLRRNGTVAPIFVARATICNSVPHSPVRRAQLGVTNSRHGILPGPDTDTLDRIWDRRDGCHFSAEGNRKHARLWVKALEPYFSSREKPG